MAVLRPLKVVIENYPEGQSEELDAVNHPDDPAAGTRKVPFGRELYIEQDDFMENPPKKFFRLSPGAEVRLRYAYFITCKEVVKNAAGEVTELRCTYDPGDQGRQRAGRPQGQGDDPLGVGEACRRPPRCASTTAVRQAGPDRRRELRRRSQPACRWKCSADAKIEPALGEAELGEPVQFERLGYFTPDPDTSAGQAGVQPDCRPARHLCQSDRPARPKADSRPRVV